MKYPKKLAKRADEILAARRWDAERRQAHTLALLHEQHPEVEAARRSLASLYAKRGTAAIFEPDTLEGIDAQISAGREQLQALMAAAGITEADLEPSYTCPACMDRGMANGQTCTCRQTILNQLVYEQLCDVSPARECSFDNFSLAYTNVEYAEPVEYGHRTRGGKGFVKGHHMMAISLEEVSEKLPAYLQEWLNDFISTHDL